jgi:hypothetical protein
VVSVSGRQIARHLIDVAEDYNIPVLLTDHSLFVSSGRLSYKLPAADLKKSPAGRVQWMWQTNTKTSGC